MGRALAGIDYEEVSRVCSRSGEGCFGREGWIEESGRKDGTFKSAAEWSRINGRTKELQRYSAKQADLLSAESEGSRLHYGSHELYIVTKEIERVKTPTSNRGEFTM
jgi:hypothetical protein